MYRTSGSVSSSGDGFQWRLTRDAVGIAIDRTTLKWVASHRHRVVNGPDDVRRLADDPPPHAGAGRFLQHDRDAARTLALVTTTFAGKHRLHHCRPQSVRASTIRDGRVGKPDS